MIFSEASNVQKQTKIVKNGNFKWFYKTYLKLFQYKIVILINY